MQTGMGYCLKRDGAVPLYNCQYKQYTVVAMLTVTCDVDVSHVCTAYVWRCLDVGSPSWSWGIDQDL